MKVAYYAVIIDWLIDSLNKHALNAISVAGAKNTKTNVMSNSKVLILTSQISFSNLFMWKSINY